ncbi:MAG: IS1634 family transposase [bacterium]
MPPKESEKDKEQDENYSEDKIFNIQSQIAMNAITRYNLTSNIIHYDITSIFFEGDYEENEMIVLGYSRDHRNDAKQINLGLNTIDDYAIPISHNVYKGNTADISTVISNMQRLKEIIKSKELIVVSDRGTVSLKNLLSLKNASVRFISTLSLSNKEEERDFSNKKQRILRVRISIREE